MSISRYDGAQAVRPSNMTLADVLERILDKGLVIVGDIQVNVLDIELLTLKVRLLIASVETAQAIGIDWWTGDPTLSKSARDLHEENRSLKERVERLERSLSAGDGRERRSEEARPRRP
jgi:hypothetical protein